MNLSKRSGHSKPRSLRSETLPRTRPNASCASAAAGKTTEAQKRSSLRSTQRGALACVRLLSQMAQRTAKLQYVLDTDTCIYLLNDVPSVKKHVLQTGVDSLAISIITLAELFFGAHNSQQKEHNLRKIKDFITPPAPQILSLTHAIVEKFGEVKADLVRRGQIIGDFDILIASTALVHKSVVVTNNQEHYQRIKGLRLENWLQ
jgi:predicted nucleic acid-binding protein